MASTLSENRQDQQPQTNIAIYHKLQELKEQRETLYQSTATFKGELSEARFQHYARVKTLSLKQQPTEIPPTTNRTVIGRQPLIAKTENLLLHNEPLYLANNYSFSGTDNGIVKMTENVSITVNKLLYHLRLYNRFQALERLTDDELTYEQLISQVEPVTTNNGDVNLDEGHFRRRRRLEERKKTENGKTVAQLEKRLGQNSLKAAFTTDGIHEASADQVHCRPQIRSFYALNKECHLEIKKELTDSRFRDR